MRLFSLLPGHSRALPRDVAAGVGLEHGERVLAHGRTHDGRYAVATDRALFLPRESGHVRLGWERIAKASWQEGVLHVTEAGEPGTAPPVHHLPLEDPGQLADAVHDRVTSTIVVSEHLPLVGRAGVRAIGRRPPAESASPDELLWSLSFDEGVNPHDPEVQDRAAQALDDLRRQMGV